MLPRSLPAGSVEELTFRLGNLEIGISVRRAPSPTRSDVETASSTGWEFVDQQEPVAVPLYEFPRSLEAAALRASTASELSGLPLDFLSPLARQLRGSDLTWTPRARIARAFKAGVLGALRLAGETSNQSSIRIPYRNTFYVVLRSPRARNGGWTNDYGIYIRAVSPLQSRQLSFDPTSVSHACPSRAEAEAYLAGSRQPWPLQLQ